MKHRNVSFLHTTPMRRFIVLTWFWHRFKTVSKPFQIRFIPFSPSFSQMRHCKRFRIYTLCVINAWCHSRVYVCSFLTLNFTFVVDKSVLICYSTATSSNAVQRDYSNLSDVLVPLDHSFHNHTLTWLWHDCGVTVVRSWNDRDVTVKWAGHVIYAWKSLKEPNFMK